MRWTLLDWIDYLVFVTIAGMFVYYTKLDVDTWQFWVFIGLVTTSRILKTQTGTNK